MDNTLLNGLRNLRLLRVVQADDMVVDTYHDRIRESVLAAMPPRQLADAHRRLVDAIESVVGRPSEQELAAWCEGSDCNRAALRASGRLYDLSYHCDAAGLEKQALAYGMLAAKQAAAQYSVEVVAEQLTIAKRNATNASEATRFQISSGRADALHLLGRYEEASLELDECPQYCSSNQEFAQLALIKGFNEYYQGRITEAIRVYEEALERLGIRIPKSNLGLFLSIVKELSLATVFRLARYRPRQRDDETVKTTIDLLNRMGQPYAFQSSLPALWSTAKTSNRVRALPPSRTSGFAIGQSAMFRIMAMGKSEGAKRRLDEALAVGSQADDLWLMGIVHNCRGVGMYAAGHYQESAEDFRLAMDAFQRAGDQWMRTLARFHLASCYYGLGRLEDAAEETMEAIRLSKRFGDSRIMCTTWLLSRMTNGDFDFPAIQPHFPDRPDDVMSTTHGRLAHAQYLLHQGDTAAALRVAEEAWSEVWRWKCINSHTILILPMVARTNRLHAETLASSDPKESTRLQRRSLKFARWASRSARFIPSTAAMSLREAAECFRAAGNLKLALKLANKSCRSSEALDSPYELALSSLLAAEIKVQLGIADADQDLQQARETVAQYQASVKGRFKSLTL